MNGILKNTLLGMCAVGLLAGCASKDVEYDGSSVTNVDKKMDSVSVSDDRTGNTSTDSNYTNSSNKLQMITNESVNRIVTIADKIDGKIVLLESVHFAFDKYKLSDKMREVTSSNYVKIDEVSQSYDSLKIKLEGNCDEWG